MADFWAKIVVLGLTVSTCFGQSNSQQQDPSSPPVLPTLSPPLPPPWILVPHPDPLPSSADAPVPDLGTIPGAPDKSKSRMKRAIDRLAPTVSMRQPTLAGLRRLEKNRHLKPTWNSQRIFSVTP
jgi:hypothetical protein